MTDDHGAPSQSQSMVNVSNVSALSSSGGLTSPTPKHRRILATEHLENYKEFLCSLLQTVQRGNTMDRQDAFLFLMSTTVKEYHFSTDNFLALQFAVMNTVSEKLIELTAAEKNN